MLTNSSVWRDHATVRYRDCAPCNGAACAPVSQDEVNTRLTPGTILTLRHFYWGESLTFAPDGSLIGDARIGPWTVAAQIKVKSSKISGSNLVIHGRRLLLVFDPEEKKMRDLLGVSEKDSLASSFAKVRGQHEQWKDVARGEDVTITIQSPLSTASLADFSPTVSEAFLRSDEALADVVPAFWHNYLCECSTQTTELAPNEPVVSSKESGVRLTHALATPSPSYSEFAALTKFSGVVKISGTVDKSGTLRDIQIIKPAGLGLEEQAIEAVQQWKFEPAWKDAEPAACRVEVEVSFSIP